MIKRLVLLALLSFSPVLSAETAQTTQTAPSAPADFTGTWTGPIVMTIDGDSRDDTALMVLTQKGTELTGTAGPSAEQQWPLLKGKVDGAAAQFDLQSDGPFIHFTIKLVEGRLKGEGKAEMDGRKFSITLDLQRKPK